MKQAVIPQGAARLIDEQIFFYVDDAAMRYEEDDLIRYLEEEVLM